jgi:group I intron endonuclease
MATGIYILTSPNGKRYVGQSINCEKRIFDHINSKYLIGSAIRKYGFENFIQEIIECDESQLDMWERFYIHFYDSFNNGYNLTEGGCGIRGYKHSEETKQKISNANYNSERYNEIHSKNTSIGKLNSGYKHSEETKEKISLGSIGRESPMKGKKVPDERKYSMGSAGRNKTWVKDPITNKRIWIEKGEL